MNLFYKLATENITELASYWRVVEENVSRCFFSSICFFL